MATSLTLFQVTNDFSVACFTRAHLDDELWFALREWDAKVIRKAVGKDRGDKSPSGPPSAKSLNRSSEQAIRASIRQAVLHMNLRNQAATSDEVKLLKAHGIIGKRAPSCSLISAPDMVKLLESFGKDQVAKDLRSALESKEGRLTTIPITSFSLERGSAAKRRPKPRATESKKRKYDDEDSEDGLDMMEDDIDDDPMDAHDRDADSYADERERDRSQIGVATSKPVRARKPKRRDGDELAGSGGGLDALIEAVEVAGQPSPARKKILSSKSYNGNGDLHATNGHKKLYHPSGSPIPLPTLQKPSSTAAAFLVEAFSDQKVLSALQRILNQGVSAMQDPAVAEAINSLGDTFVNEFMRKNVRNGAAAGVGLPPIQSYRPYNGHHTAGMMSPTQSMSGAQAALSLQQLHQQHQQQQQQPSKAVSNGTDAATAASMAAYSSQQMAYSLAGSPGAVSPAAAMMQQAQSLYNWPYGSSPAATSAIPATTVMRPSYMGAPSQSPTPSGLMLMPPSNSSYPYYPVSSPHAQMMMQAQAAAAVAASSATAVAASSAAQPSSSNGYTYSNGYSTANGASAPLPSINGTPGGPSAFRSPPMERESIKPEAVM